MASPRSLRTAFWEHHRLRQIREAFGDRRFSFQLDDTAIALAMLMAVGWQTASHMCTSLIVDALQTAVIGGRVRTGAVVF
ncbi:hypothetical protein H351_31730 (plasmid) [Rhodococcus erythropolis R138]|nr:hypothetical protein H351_31730 [Rhodococcus erythropolis R138]